MSDSVRLLVRGALLLAIGALSQQLRLVLPLPVPVMTLLIGTLVNATLVLAGRYTTRVLAWTICVALAVIAFFQGHILGPVVPVIALGNGMYVELTRTGSKGSALFLGAPLGKTLVLAIGMVGALRLLQLPWGAVTKTLSIFLPLQLATGILGNINTDLYEAADIDGATGMQKFYKITLPFVVFSITPVLISMFVGSFNNFGIFFFLRSGTYSLYGDYFLASDTDLLINWLYNLSVSNNYYSIGAAISLIIFLITGTLSLAVYVRTAAYKQEDTFQ